MRPPSLLCCALGFIVLAGCAHEGDSDRDLMRSVRRSQDEARQHPLPPPTPPPAIALPPPLACGMAPPSAAEPPIPKVVRPEFPVAGQMTEQATQALRMYDIERWKAAVPLLRSVAAGETRDDEGNRQLAQYHLGVALFRLEQFDASADVFSVIAAKPNHLKHNETLLWLAKLAERTPTSFRIADLDGYDSDTIDRFNNANQRALYWELSYLLGRWRYEKGRHVEAAALFRRVSTEPESVFRDEAAHCLQKLSGG